MGNLITAATLLAFQFPHSSLHASAARGILGYSVRMPIIIRKLQATDASAWWELRLQALETVPFAFGKTPEEHCATTIESVQRRFGDPHTEDFTLGAFENGTLVGMATFVRELSSKERHKGHIYGVYVSASARGAGTGRALIAELIRMVKEHGSVEQLLLAVGHTQIKARSLYNSLGFTKYGTEPNALKVGNTYIDEDYMILRIR